MSDILTMLQAIDKLREVRDANMSLAAHIRTLEARLAAAQQDGTALGDALSDLAKAEARNAELEETLANIRKFYPDKSESSPLSQTEEARNLYHGNWIRAEARAESAEALAKDHQAGVENVTRAWKEAEARCARYATALRFYADGTNWGHNIGPDREGFWDSEMNRDEGKRARQALSAQPGEARPPAAGGDGADAPVTCTHLAHGLSDPLLCVKCGQEFTP